jgi:PhzF family phenazine biosynthesis protein
MTEGSLHRLSAFTTDPRGGNPAGVWVGERLPEPERMLRIATEVGFSETAFLAPTSGSRRRVRYYSPRAEVSFCGHATIASGVLLGEQTGDGSYDLETAVGEVSVRVRLRNDVREATLVSVEPEHTPVPEALLEDVLSTLGWRRDELDPAIAPARAYAGAWHLVLAAARADRLASLEYDFDRLDGLMRDDGLTTLQLVWRESAALFHSRNPFPVGGVVEDPATGAAAAALGGYLRAAGLLTPPASFVIRQGEAMGRPSRLSVEVPPEGGIAVSGSAVHLP